jgi:hypothetical protein
MKPYKEIRKIISSNENVEKLCLLIPEEYRYFLVSYFGCHNPPNERKQAKDLRYLRQVLKI